MSASVSPSPQEAKPLNIGACFCLGWGASIPSLKAGGNSQEGSHHFVRGHHTRERLSACPSSGFSSCFPTLQEFHPKMPKKWTGNHPNSDLSQPGVPLVRGWIPVASFGLRAIHQVPSLDPAARLPTGGLGMCLGKMGGTRPEGNAPRFITWD